MNCNLIRITIWVVFGLSYLNQGCSPAVVTDNSQGTDVESDDPGQPPTDEPVDTPDLPSDEDEPPPIDDDPVDPGSFHVISSSSLSSGEGGGTTQFSVILDRAPTAAVTIPIAASNPAEATVSPDSLTFTPENWNTPQQVKISGVDDPVDDGDVEFTVIVGPTQSTDPDFDSLEPDEVAIINRDNDTAGVTVLADQDATTNESGATTTFTIALSSQPTENVTIAFSSEPTSEIAVAPASVSFDSENWNEPQTVTLTGLDDANADGDVAATVVIGPAVSADATYDGTDATDVTVINIDNDSQSFVLEPDDFPASTPLTNALAAVTLSTALNDNTISTFEVTASDDGLDLEPTGQRVFGHEDIQFFNSDRRLRLDFHQPASQIHLTFGGGTFFETEVGVMQVYDASNTLLAEYITAPLGAGVIEVMTIARPTADIAWAVAYSQNSFGRLDYLEITVAIAP